MLKSFDQLLKIGCKDTPSKDPFPTGLTITGMRKASKTHQQQQDEDLDLELG